MHIKVPTLVIGYLQDSEKVSHPGDEGSDMQGRVDVLTSILRLGWCQVRSGGQGNVHSGDQGKGVRHHIYQSPLTGCRVKCHEDYFNGSPIAAPGVSVVHISTGWIRVPHAD